MYFLVLQNILINPLVLLDYFYDVFISFLDKDSFFFFTFLGELTL